MKDDRNIRQLFDKYINNTCTPEEAVQLMHILQSGYNRDDIERLIETHMQDIPDVPADHVMLTGVFEKLKFNDPRKRKRDQSTRLLIIAAAAVLLVVLLVGAFMYFQQQEQTVMIAKQDVAPGGNRATLMLADGQTINLSTDQSGIVVGDEITYLDGSSVLNQKPDSSQEYTLNTPKGGTYQITLPDGTRVWLNAASILKYPSRFNEKERVVELEGEAYFEVVQSRRFARAQNRSEATSPLHESANLPFKVVSNGQTVEVLGTHFNINAYPDERATKTTLLEGTVRIVAANRSALLKPGQQSNVDTNGLMVADVDTETVVDWKNGDFIFTDETLENIMREVTRWYDVKVVYKSQLSNDRYNAQISRSKNLSEVLHILELSGGLTFRITDGILFLSPPN